MNGNPFAELGLPATWGPLPLTWNLAKLRGETPAGTEVMHVLIVSTASGVQGYKFSTDELRAMADKMLEQCTGLTLARSVEANGKHAAGS